MNFRKIIFIFLIFFSIKLFSQENNVNILKLGFVNIHDYIVHGTSQKEQIKYFRISLRENKFYEIEINYNHNNLSEYWNFKLINIEDDGKTIKGNLSEISIDDIDGTLHINNNAHGIILINLETNLVKIKIHFFGENIIIWENVNVENFN
jgi:hypothetical protein